MATTPNEVPQPETVTDFYLAAVLAELRAIHVLLSPPGTLQVDAVTRSSAKTVNPELVDLREPRKRKK
jgi:hypothetical protein